MANESDALALLKRLQGRSPAPVWPMLTILKELERLTASARFAEMVTLTDLVEWVHKEPARLDALCRVLVLVMAAGQIDSQDITAMITQIHSAERDRRKPITLIREPGDRLSQRLF
jgi:hypothetical protein